MNCPLEKTENSVKNLVTGLLFESLRAANTLKNHWILDCGEMTDWTAFDSYLEFLHPFSLPNCSFLFLIFHRLPISVGAVI